MIDLRRDLPRIGVSKDALSFVNLSVSCVHAGLAIRADGACAVVLKLERPAKILAEDAHSEVCTATVTVWEQGGIVSGDSNNMARQVSNEIDIHAAALVAQFYRDNP